MDSLTPYGPITAKLYGTQDVRGFFERAAANLTDGEREVVAEAERDATPTMLESVAWWLGKSVEDVTEADIMCWQDDLRREQEAIDAEAADYRAQEARDNAEEIEREKVLAAAPWPTSMPDWDSVDPDRVPF